MTTDKDFPQNSFPEMIEFFDMVKNNFSSHTYRSYKSSIERFAKYCNINSLEDMENMTRKNYLAYQQYLSKPKNQGGIYGMSESSVNTHLMTIKSFVEFLTSGDQPYSKNKSIYDVEALKVVKKKKYFPTNEEINSMINAVKRPQEKLMLLLMAQAGLRREEITNVKIVDFYNSNILVHGKGSKERTVPLTDEFMNFLNEYLRTRNNDSEYLFTAIGHKGKIGSGEAIYGRVKEASKDAGLSDELVKKIGPHSFRKYFGKFICRTSGVDVAQTLLGHSNVAVTIANYDEVDEERKINAISKMPSMLNKN